MPSNWHDRTGLPWGSPVELETWRRITIAVWAYAYEIRSEPIATDAEFDELASTIDLSIDTTRPDMDKWFRENFEPFTGMWVHNHPEQARLFDMYCITSKSTVPVREKLDHIQLLTML